MNQSALFNSSLKGKRARAKNTHILDFISFFYMTPSIPAATH